MGCGGGLAAGGGGGGAIARGWGALTAAGGAWKQACTISMPCTAGDWHILRWRLGLY